MTRSVFDCMPTSFNAKVNPQTVLFLGYSDNQLGLLQFDLTHTDRTLFAKIGYAWTF